MRGEQTLRHSGLAITLLLFITYQLEATEPPTSTSVEPELHLATLRALDTLIVDQAQEGINYGFAFDRDLERWQEFRPVRTNIAKVDAYIDRRGNPGDAVLTIKNRQQQTIHTVTIPQSNIPIGTNWISIPISPILTVTAESTYTVHLKTPNPRPSFDNSYYWQGLTSSAYARGVSDVESSWRGFDYGFRTYASIPESQLPQYTTSGLSGHLGTNLNNGQPMVGYQHGLSFYSSVYLLDPNTSRSTQLGWGTWWMPENLTFAQPLCPVGTFARDNWPERGPTYRDVYQTLEGGMGQWGSTRFPSASPKYRINGVPDCYNTQIGSPGWSFHGDPLASNKLGIAQLSNRLLLAPDGVTFSNASTASLLGNGWIALPIIPAATSGLGVPTGDQGWTLFFHAANFKGPVAFFTPEVWSAVNAVDRTGVGRGHDARPGFTGGIAIEIGMTPAYTATDNAGVRYKRIPRLTFPVDANGRAILLQDVRYYSKQAVWDAVSTWIQTGTVATQVNSAGLVAPTVSGSGVGVHFGGTSATYDASFYAGMLQTNTTTVGFGFQWTGAMEPGVFPEYYKEEGQAWRAIPASQVPASTGLANQAFPRAEPVPFTNLSTSPSSPWTRTAWAAGPFTAVLNDSSIVEYVWYKFIEQPAISRLGLPADVLQRMQTFVESLHQHSGTNGITIPPPTSGTLVTIDPALIVTPPTGMERGYVPIVIRQYVNEGNVSQLEIDALTAFYNNTGGSNWTNKTNWLTGMVRDWHGVTVTNGRVTRIDLYQNNLTGSIPSEFGNLAGLEHVELSQNTLNGSLPSTLGNLTNLTFFSAFNNQLTGSIPSTFGNFRRMTLLQLGNNRLAGPIPSELGQMTNLEHLFLAGNQLTGGVPGQLGSLSNLRSLELASNQLSGPLPLTLQNLRNLTSLAFHNTQICEPQESAFQTWLRALPTLSTSGIACAPSAVEYVDPSIPTAFALGQNFPNPFNPTTTITFDLPQQSEVLLTLHNTLGQQVDVLTNETLPAGRFAQTVDARDLPSGVYYYRLRAGSFQDTKKLVLLR